MHFLLLVVVIIAFISDSAFGFTIREQLKKNFISLFSSLAVTKNTDELIVLTFKS